MPNEFEKVLEDFGHGVEKLFSDGKSIEQKIQEGIIVAKDVVSDSPKIVADVAKLSAAVVGGKAIEGELVAVLEQLGTNPVTDLALLEQIVTQFPAYKAYVESVETAGKQLLTDLGADLKQIEAVFAPSAPAGATTETPAAS